jgi:hypothetical protein
MNDRAEQVSAPSDSALPESPEIDLKIFEGCGICVIKTKLKQVRHFTRYQNCKCIAQDAPITYLSAIT